jgi:MinD-like ATPase involved in chromosome partitioning or flagellar assembly
MGKTIGIISIKGGVGKTSITANLGAIIASEFKKKVLLIDGNLSSPNLGLHLNMEKEKGIHHVLEGQANLKDAILSSTYGFDLLPASSIVLKTNPLKIGEKIRDLRRKYDFIFIDSSPNLNDEILGVMMASDELLVVTTPDHVTLAMTARAVRLAKEKRTPITGIILNKVYGKKFEIPLKKIEEITSVPVVGLLPHDSKVLQALSKNIPSSMHKNTTLTKEYRKLAASIIGKDHPQGLMKRLMQNFFTHVPKHEVNQTILKNERRANPFY